MSQSAFSPTLTATSSTSGFRSTSNTEVENMVDLDINMASAPGDFSDLFNFDEYDNGDLSSHSHSPNTISPNHTPSPLPATGASPYALSMSPSYDFLNDNRNQFSFDYMMDEKSLGDAGPVTMGFNNPLPVDTIQIKEEPSYDFGFTAATSLSPPAAQAPQQVHNQPEQPNLVNNPLISFDGLPVDQQAALQQLMANIMNYQKSFGLEVAPAQTTVKPSELFGISPQTASSSSYVTPSSFASPPIAIPQQQQQPTTLAEVTESFSHEEPLNSVEPHEIASAPGPSRSIRQASTFSSVGDDLDEKLDRLAPLSEIFSAGKGKGGKKGGGMSSVVKQSDEELDEDDSWRPSPEEYKKLSSKEKRQLRNKLSARAFRTRRKDYIGTLEGHIRDRDSVIDAIRSELTTSRTENQDLRRELNALKASTMSILHPESASKVSQSPAMLNALSMTSLSGLPPAKASPASPQIKRTTTPTYPINVRKDLPTSGAGYDSQRGFWGGNGGDNMFGGGSTICHTILTPDIGLPSPHSIPQLRSIADLPRVNLNPLLNTPSSSTNNNTIQPLSSSGNDRDLSGSFSDWSENTPFSLRSMDSYRIQMWSRLAREAQSDKMGLVGDMRPKFYVDQSGKSSPVAPITTSPTTPSSTMVSSSDPITPPTPAQLATIASTHISSKLAGAFWSAFSTSGKLDTNKLTDVVTGKSHLAIVSSTTSSSSSTSNSASTSASKSTSPSSSSYTTTYNEKIGLSPHSEEEDTLSTALSGLRLQTGQGQGLGLATATAGGRGVRENPLGALTGFLGLVAVCPSRCPARA